ncbi:uncharacterized protein N7459_007160 [Penicillium hispanicum]|uniref:uncharacterized protein n=1 Tax=Penicillium hispanicum TaxID=1080232 RepID=UPI00254206F8|nr:uncharacterized protein N7459_007160 [Penicillium hispanicum]KAJ5578196.1 hypothetical protein N7459_007160 [Penicillium hispanicum]
MADPYNPYTSYSTPTPGGIGYYPPEEQNHQSSTYPYQQPYGTADPQPDPNYSYASQPSPYYLAPEPYHQAAPERSYTPAGQPDLDPVAPAGLSPVQPGKVPENLSYYGHPAEQPRYSPSPSPQPPSVYVSDEGHTRSSRDDSHAADEDADPESERGLGSSLAGGAAGYYLGHKKDHGFLGAIGGAIIGNMLEHQVKDHGRHSPSHHRHGHHHHHHHHGHSRSRSRSRSHSRHRGEDDY